MSCLARREGGLVEMKILVDDKEVFTTGKIPKFFLPNKSS